LALNPKPATATASLKAASGFLLIRLQHFVDKASTFSRQGFNTLSTRLRHFVDAASTFSPPYWQQLWLIKTYRCVFDDYIIPSGILAGN
jgi:hypothetical protein